MSQQIVESVVPLKSDNDDREYRSITLSNGMQILLISDPNTDKSAATVAVNVGSLSDTYLGSAHFLEHLLFQGTEKYPNEAEYAKYISLNAGSNNAWTAATTTNYYFDIAADHFAGALERLSWFFKAPLFDASCVDRELNAVQSEHNKNITNDSWQAYELLRQVVKPEHPMADFHTGDLTTLKDAPLKDGTNPRDVVIKLFNEYYSSNLMKAVFYAKESLDEMQDLAVQHLAPIKNKNIQTPTFSTDVLQDKGGVVLERCPITPQRSLSITMLLPSDYDTKYTTTLPLNVLSYAIGDEGAGSLLSLLKAMKFATSLSSGRLHQLPFCSSFQVTIGLTETGLSYIPDILRLFYAYIDMLKKMLALEFDVVDATTGELKVKEKGGDFYRLCKQIQQLDEIQFKYKEKQDASSTVTSLIDHMYRFDPLYVVQNESIYQEINLYHINEFLQHFGVENSVFSIAAGDVAKDIKLIDAEELVLTEKLKNAQIVNEFAQKDFALDELNAKCYKNKQWDYEPFYQFKFAKYPISEKIKTYITTGLTNDDLQTVQVTEPTSYGAITDQNQLLTLPEENKFIPQNFDLLTSDDKSIDDKITVYTANNTTVDLMPLKLDCNNNNEYQISQLDLSYLKDQCTYVPKNDSYTLDEFKALIKQLVEDNLIGFDKTHINLDPTNTSDKDITKLEEIAKKLFINLENDPTLPPKFNVAELAKEAAAAGEDAAATVEAAEAAIEAAEQQEEEQQQGEEEEEEDDGEEEQQQQDDGGEEQAGGVGKLWDVDSYLSRPDTQRITQFIPPQQLAVPLPKKHFTITNTPNTSAVQPPVLPPVELWYKFVDAYKVPNVELRVELRLPNVPFELLSLYNAILKDSLAEALYSATLCGLQFSVDHTPAGISITVSGHREPANATIIKIVDTIAQTLFSLLDAKDENTACVTLFDNLNILTRQFDRLIRNSTGLSFIGAIQQCMQNAGSILNKNQLHFKEKLAKIMTLKEKFLNNTDGDEQKTEVLNNLKQQLKLHNIVIACIGNVTEKYAIKIAQYIVHILNCVEISTNDIQYGEMIVGPKGVNDIIAINNGNIKDNQNAVINYYTALEPFRVSFKQAQTLINNYKKYNKDKNNNNIDNINIDNLNLNEMFNNMTFYGKIIYNFFLSHITTDHVFDTLRTKQQLGYIVAQQHLYNQTGYGLVFYAQSSYTPSYVDQRIEQYIRYELPKMLLGDILSSSSSNDNKNDNDDDMKDDDNENNQYKNSPLLNTIEFLTSLSGTQSSLLSKFNNMGNEASFFFTPIFNRSYDFSRALILALLLPYLNRTVLLLFYYNYYYNMQNRNKLAIHIWEQQKHLLTSTSTTKSNDDDKTQQEEIVEKITADYNEYIVQNVITDVTNALALKYTYPTAKY